jgi:cysteine sulfinate desulfinase/cysteine desulfurase-like protein/rhodanese-related sulfurtransferase
MTIEIYLDGNATTAVLPAAIDAAVHAMGQGFGNPSSTHAAGLKAKAMMAAVRGRAERLLGVGDGRLMFNSGATEGIQTAVLSALCALRERRDAGQAIGRWLVYGATEHKAVPESLAHWNRLLGLNLPLKKLAVGADGRHDLAALRALAPEAALVCTMAANNETGVISDLAGIEATLEATASATLWLVDCVQGLGKLDLNLATTRIDYAPFSGHKLYAPKGIGMLYVRAGAPFTALMMGGGQESGLRSGTENMAGIAALGAVLAAVDDGLTFASHATLAAYRDRLAASLRAALPGLVFNADFALSLPTTLNFSVPGIASKELLDLFDAAGLRVSSGSACSAAKAAPSYVLEAMGLPEWRSGAAIRLSFGPSVGEAVIAAACSAIERCGAALRGSCLMPQAPGASVIALPATASSDGRGGVIQLVADGACTWLVTDAASRSCVVVDPQPALVGRIAAYVSCQALELRAVLHTAAPEDGGAARATLLDALAGHGAIAAGGDAFGWPAVRTSITLGNGAQAATLLLGRQTLVRLQLAGGDGAQCVYLLGEADSPAAPRFAFCGAVPPQVLGRGLIGEDTLVCAGRDEHSVFCTSLRAERDDVQLPGETEMRLSPAALEDFLLQHPDAILVDVRESYEHAAGEAPALAGKSARSVPLSRLVAQLPLWLAEARAPLVLFCRSGNRSGKAVACLRRLGYAQAWHVAGGLALDNGLLLAA